MVKRSTGRGIYRVASSQGKVRENKILSRSVKSQGISLKVRELVIHWKSHEKVHEFCGTVLVTHDT